MNTKTRHRRPARYFLWGLGILALTAAMALAQTNTARVEGVVIDPNGAAVAGATVTATNLATTRPASTQTGSSGDYTLSALQPGRYRIEVKQSNFKTTAQDVTLETSQVAGINFQLQPGGVSEVVEISAGTPLVDTQTSAIGEVIEGRQVTELPLNGRNFTQLATLVPGVNRGVPDGQASGAGNQAETFRYGNTGGASLSINGQRPQANNFLLDGTDNNESLVNSIVFFPPAEAIQEFRVQTSVAPAEFGRAGGGIINTTIKSGSNGLHGSAFEFLRNSALDARETFISPKPEFRRNQFGFTLGGPIIKNKVFIFGDYQGLRQFLPLGLDRASVPTQAFRNGDFSALLAQQNPIQLKDPLTGADIPGNRIDLLPGNRINKVGQNYLNAFPLPNAPGLRQNYLVTRTQIQHFNDFDTRVDWNVRTTDQFFGRFSFGQDEEVTSSRLPNLPAGFGSGTQFNRSRGVTLGETHTFSPTIVNEARFGFIREFLGFLPPFQNTPVSANLGIPGANPSPLLGGGALIGGFNDQIEYSGDFGPYRVPENTFQYADIATMTRNKHTFRFGANIIRRQVNLFRPNRGKGYFFLFGNGTGLGSSGYEVSDLLIGFVNNYQIGPPFGSVGTRSWENGFFFQDDWRVTRKLTLNLGLRYDYLTFPSEIGNRQTNFDVTTGRLLQAGQNGNTPSLLRTDKNNFAPRVGFAYDLTGEGKTVVRGGYGIFYFIDRGGIDNQLAQNPPFSGFSQFDYSNGFRITLSGAGPQGSNDSRLATGPLPTGSVAGVDLNNPQNVTVFAELQTNVIPYVQQYNLQVERQLDKNSALSVGYVGAKGTHLTAYYNLNRNLFNAASGARLFPNLGSVNVKASDSSSIYHSLQVQLERRLTKGWQYTAAYTWAHTIDDNAGAYDTQQVQNIFNRRLERANSSLDQRHRFVFSSLYELPFGRGRLYGSNISRALDYVIGNWQLNGILTLASGFPFNITEGGVMEVRPDLVSAPQFGYSADPAQQGVRYFNTSAFNKVPTNSQGVFIRPGSLGRNAFRGPGTHQLDFSFFKNFAIIERSRLQFRTEIFNVFNTPQYAQPNGDINSGQFGLINSTRLGTNRQIQFALRLDF